MLKFEVPGRLENVAFVYLCQLVFHRNFINVIATKMAHVYENEELVNMLIIYGECRQNAAAASRLYAERFPLRVHPFPRNFLNLLHRSRERCVEVNGDNFEHII